MKNALMLLTIALLGMFFVTGCSSENTTVGKAFIGGVEGLKTSFIEGSPPKEIFDNGQSGFSIVVQIENVGEHTIKKNEGYVKINGLDPGTYGESGRFEKKFDSEITGARKNFDGTVLNGGIATVEFGDLKYRPEIQGNLQQKVWADVCYLYTTKTTTQLCIKSNPETLVGNQKICTVEGEKNPQNSGAPIQVTSLKESFAGNGKIGITLVIEHAGKGDNFFKDSDAVCDDSESNNNRGKVRVKFNPVKIGGRSVNPQCAGLSDARSGASDGYIRLYKDGSGKERYSLYCTVDASSTDSIFEVPVDVELTYRYLQHIETPITIRHTVK